MQEVTEVFSKITLRILVGLSVDCVTIEVPVDWTVEKVKDWTIFHCLNTDPAAPFSLLNETYSLRQISNGDGNWLLPSQTLKECGLCSKEWLELLVKSTPECPALTNNQIFLQVFAPSLRGYFPMTVEGCSTIREIKRKVMSQSSVFRCFGDDCRLYVPFGDSLNEGAWLDDNRTVKSYHLSQGDILHLRLRVINLPPEEVVLTFVVQSKLKELRFPIDTQINEVILMAADRLKLCSSDEVEVGSKFSLHVLPSRLHPEGFELNPDVTLRQAKLSDKTQVRLLELIPGISKNRKRNRKSSRSQMVNCSSYCPVQLPFTPVAAKSEPLCTIRAKHMGPLAGKVFSVGVQGARVGRRTKDNDIVVPGTAQHPQGDDTVSREHALLYYHERSFFVRNLSSRNVTGVQPAGVDANVQRLKQFEEKELFSGDTLFIGVRSQFECEVTIPESCFLNNNLKDNTQQHCSSVEFH